MSAQLPGSAEMGTAEGRNVVAVTVADGDEVHEVPRDETQGRSLKADLIIEHSQKLQDELRFLGLKIKKHEDHIELLKAEKNQLDGSILDKQGILVRFHSAIANVGHNEEETTAQILRHERSAAGILCHSNAQPGTPQLPFKNDVLGIVAELGSVDSDNLSRLLSEFLGQEIMMAIVCRTYEGVKALETYDKEGNISKTSGVHGLAASVGRSLEGSFDVICLEHLIPCACEIVADDPQRRLDLLKPELPNGDSPPGFLGFAVNMINVDSTNLLRLTQSGYGLRETLFYGLFSHLQVYRTRNDMLQARSCITDGAISLDGGMIRNGYIYCQGDGADISVRFPISHVVSSLPGGYAETENEIKAMKCKRERVLDDLQRERRLLERAKVNFERQKQECIKFLAESAPCLAQNLTTQP